MLRKYFKKVVCALAVASFMLTTIIPVSASGKYFNADVYSSGGSWLSDTRTQKTSGNGIMVTKTLVDPVWTNFNGPDPHIMTLYSEISSRNAKSTPIDIDNLLLYYYYGGVEGIYNKQVNIGDWGELSAFYNVGYKFQTLELDGNYYP